MYAVESSVPFLLDLEIDDVVYSENARLYRVVYKSDPQNPQNPFGVEFKYSSIERIQGQFMHLQGYLHDRRHQGMGVIHQEETFRKMIDIIRYLPSRTMVSPRRYDAKKRALQFKPMIIVFRTIVKVLRSKLLGDAGIPVTGPEGDSHPVVDLEERVKALGGVGKVGDLVGSPSDEDPLKGEISDIQEIYLKLLAALYEVLPVDYNWSDTETKWFSTKTETDTDTVITSEGTEPEPE